MFTFSVISVVSSLAMLTPSVLAQAQFPPVTVFRAGDFNTTAVDFSFCEFTNGVFTKIQVDGNLAVVNAENVNLWAASNFGGDLVPDFPTQSCPLDGQCEVIFQNDGNLVTLYAGVPLWNSATQGRGAWFVCQEIAPWFYIVDGDGNFIWTTSSGPTQL